MENWWYPENFSESTTSKRPLWWIAPHPPVSGPCQQLTKSLQHWPSPELEQDAPCKLIQRKRRDIHGFQLVISIDFYVKCFKPPAAGQASRSRTRNEHLRNEALISVQYIHVCIYIYVYIYVRVYNCVDPGNTTTVHQEASWPFGNINENSTGRFGGEPTRIKSYSCHLSSVQSINAKRVERKKPSQSGWRDGGVA